MSSKKSFAYAASSINVKEQAIISMDKVEEIAKMKNANAAFANIVETGYGGADIGMQDYEKLINMELDEAYSYVISILPDSSMLDFYLRKKDYQNLKVLFKLKLLDKKPEDKYFVKNGCVDLSVLKDAVANKASVAAKGLPKAMSEAVDKTADILDVTADASLIGLYMDSAYLNELAEIFDTADDITKEYIRTYADYTNVITYMRLTKAGYVDKYFGKLYCRAGSISMNEIKRAFSAGREKSAFGKRLVKAVQLALAESTTAPIEFARSDELIERLKQHKMELNTMAPCLYYLELKEREADNIRTIMIAKLNNKNYAFIKDRLKRMP